MQLTKRLQLGCTMSKPFKETDLENEMCIYPVITTAEQTLENLTLAEN